MKIELTINMPKGKESKKETPSLEERVDYAIDCIACGHHKGEAIAFLQELKARMETKFRQTKEYQDLLNKVSQALADYGHYHLRR